MSRAGNQPHKTGRVTVNLTSLPLRLLWCTIVASVIASFQESRVMTSIDHGLLDARVRLARFWTPSSRRISVVSIDTRALERMDGRYGSWPWSPDLLAELVDYLGEARVVAFDLLLPESVEAGEQGRQLTDAVRRHGRVVSALHLENVPRLHPSPESLDGHTMAGDPEAAYPFIRSGTIRFPYPDLLEASLAVGHVNHFPDSDGVVRRGTAAVRMGDQVFPSLFLAATAVRPDGVLDPLSLEEGRVWFGTRSVEIDYRGRFLMRFPGPGYRTFSAADILESAKAEAAGQTPAFPRSLFRDQVVLIGRAATGRGGHREVTPAFVRTPSTEISAVGMDNLLAGGGYQVPSALGAVLWVVALALLPGLFRLERPSRLLLTGALLVLLYGLIVLVALFFWRLMLPMAAPVSAALLSGAVLTVIYWYGERAQRGDLERLDRAKQQFIDMLVHDLKGRCGSMVLSMDLLRRRNRDLDTDSIRLFEGLHDTAQRLLADTRALLDIRKMEEGRMSLQREEFDAAALIHEVLEEMRPAGALLKLELVGARMGTSGGLLAVKADREVLGRILSNLLWNAFQHAPRSSEVSVCYGALNGGGLRLEITNDGPPIPAEQQAALMEPFHSGDLARRIEGMGGTGLGLAFCRLAAEAHGGDLDLVSPCPGGTRGVRVDVRLPV